MAFSLSESARAELRLRLEQTSVPKPVFSLLDSTQGYRTSDEMTEALSREAPESEILEIAKREFEQQRPALEFLLDLGVYAADECIPEHLLTIDGIPFAMPKEMAAYFENFVLEYQAGQFLLNNGKRTFKRLGDLRAEDGNAA